MNVYFSDILLKEISPSCKLVYNKTDKTKYQLKLINVRCPFGAEEFQNKIYLNVELKKDEYDHQVLLKDIKLIETFLLKDTNMEKTSNIKNDILFKLTIPQISKKIIAKCYQNQKECTIFDVKGKKCDIIIDINSIWVFGQKTGVQFTVKTINILD
jgi:hypothetical protein